MSVMNLTGVIASFKTGTYTVFRPDSTSYDVNGRIVPPDYGSVEVDACVQPTGGADLKRLPQGLQTDEVKTIWAAYEFALRDRVVINGEPWEVQKVERWAELGAYWRAFVTKLNQN